MIGKFQVRFGRKLSDKELPRRGSHLARSLPNTRSANTRGYLLQRTRRKVQLIVSEETVTEYLQVLRWGGVTRGHPKDGRVDTETGTATNINLGVRPTDSRSPYDNQLCSNSQPYIEGYS